MTTISLQHARRQSLIHDHAWNWVPSLHPLVQGLGRLTQQGLGLAMLFAGAAMLLTLWLIPLGLPLAMLGLAFVSE